MSSINHVRCSITVRGSDDAVSLVIGLLREVMVRIDAKLKRKEVRSRIVVEYGCVDVIVNSYIVCASIPECFNNIRVRRKLSPFDLVFVAIYLQSNVLGYFDKHYRCCCIQLTVLYEVCLVLNVPSVPHGDSDQIVRFEQGVAKLDAVY